MSRSPAAESLEKLYKNNRVAVVIPAYNEARQIEQVIRTVPDLVDQVIVVDDCSVDDTAAAIQAIGNQRVVALRTPMNQGVGGGMMVGYRKAGGTEVRRINQLSGTHKAKLFWCLFVPSGAPCCVCFYN